jgi:hypothetical protein
MLCNCGKACLQGPDLLGNARGCLDNERRPLSIKGQPFTGKEPLTVLRDDDPEGKPDA